MTQHHESIQIELEGTAFVSENTAFGAGVSARGGSMGLARGCRTMGIGMAPISATGATVELSAYGLKKFVEK